MTDDDNVRRLPVQFKVRGDDDPVLKVVRAGADGCDHRMVVRDGKIRSVTYQIRDGETEVECSECGTRLDPMWVLAQLASKESHWHRARERYQDEMRRLKERERTKCVYCGKMTPISKR